MSHYMILSPLNTPELLIKANNTPSQSISTINNYSSLLACVKPSYSYSYTPIYPNEVRMVDG